jgi:hypothetical protein
MKKTAILLMLFLISSLAFGQGAMAPMAHLQFLTNAGAVCSSCTLATYAAGGTPALATYSNSTLTTANPTTITLNSSGRPSVSGAEVPIYLSPVAYKFVLKTAAGGTIWTQDNISDIGELLKVDMASTATNKGDALIGYEAAGTGATARTVHARFADEPLSVKDFGADSTGATDSTAYILAADTAASVTGTILIPKGIYKVNDLTLVSHVICQGMFAVQSGETLTINGSFEAGLYRVFSGSGTVGLGPGSVAMAYPPQWWGAEGDGITIDTVPVQAAITAAQGQVSAVRLAGKYVVDESLTFTGNQLEIFGVGVASQIINRASAGKPTFNFNAALYYNLHDFAIIGDASYPNDGIYIHDGSGFGKLANLYLFPNGTGIHLHDMNSMKIQDVMYWGSGYAAGATCTAALRLHALLADGTYVNDIHIDRMYAGNWAHIADGGAAIKWNTTNSFDIEIYSSDLEGVNSATDRSLSLKGIYGFSIRDTYVENSDMLFNYLYYGKLEQLEAGATAVITITNSSSVTVNNLYAYSFSADNTCGVINVDNSAFAAGYVNNSLFPYTQSVSTTGSAYVIDEIGSLNGVKPFTIRNDYGSTTQFGLVSEVVTLVSGHADDSTTIEIPAGAIVLGVDVRILAAPATTNYFTVTDATATTPFQTGSGVVTTLNNTDIGVKNCPYLNLAVAHKVKLTYDISPTDSAGRVRVTIHYILTGAATL